jgi:hypothetical protein
MDKAKTLSDLLYLQEVYLHLDAELIARRGEPAVKLKAGAAGWAYVMIGAQGYRLEILESSVYAANLTEETLDNYLRKLHADARELQLRNRLPPHVYRLVTALQQAAWAKEFDYYAYGT